MPFDLGPLELGLILLIVAMLFGVGKLPEVFGSIGKGVREFRKEAGMDGSTSSEQLQALQPQAPVAQVSVAQTPAVQAPIAQVSATGSSAVSPQ